jgi:integrase
LARLTDSQIRTAQPSDKIRKLADGSSLSIWILPSGVKSFRYKYRFPKKNDKGELVRKEDSYVIGRYPNVSLSAARRERDRLRGLLDDGIDPKDEKRKKMREAESRALASTFKELAVEWLDQNNWTVRHFLKVERSLELHVYPSIGSIRAEDIEYRDINTVINKLKGAGTLDMAQRVLSRITDILDYGIAQGVLKENLAKNKQLAKFIKKPKTKNFAAIEFEQVPLFLAKLKDYPGRTETIQALKLSLLTFVRPGEIRLAVWPEFDLKNSQWEIPAERVKGDHPHIVPLSRQTLTLLSEIKRMKLSGRFLLPGIKASSPISENTLTSAIKRLGFDATAHGMRSLFSTEMNERGFNSDHIEIQLAHRVGNKVRGSYNHAKWLKQRREMMQIWADLVMPDV